MKRRWLALGAALIVLLSSAVPVYWLAQLRPLDPGAEVRLFTVESGASLSRVTLDLERAGLIRNAKVAAWLARLRGLAGRVQAGEYDLSACWSTPRILDWISEGHVKTYEAVLPEGLRASEIAQRLEELGLVDAAAFLAVVHDQAFIHSLGIESQSLEGYLFPETYRMTRQITPQQIAATLVEQFRNVWSEIEPAARERGVSMHEVVTLASIVEKETRDRAERPLIAAVFLNRLRRGMRLETDPTVIYGIPDFDGNLRKRHLLDEGNLYNTYRFPGLPPGPIGNPGADALHAVVEPAQSDYLYFVSRNDGTHQFSQTYREHVNAVNRYQKRRRSR
ncbi:MAG: endolytic transglycosylase MltG [Myxococcota bacterium]